MRNLATEGLAKSERLDSQQFARRATLAVGMSALLGVAAIAWGGSGPDPYPWKGVLLWTVVALIEAAVFVSVLRSFKNQVLACLACSVVAGISAVSTALGVMLQPAYFIAHLRWLAANLIVFVAAAVTILIVRPRGRVA